MHSPAALTQFIRDALDGEVANGMEAVASSGMNVTVKSGTASVGKDPSYDINIIGTESVSIGAASPSNPMNALIVAYVDRDIAGSTAVTDNTNDVFKLKQPLHHPIQQRQRFRRQLAQQIRLLFWQGCESVLERRL